MKTEGKQHQPIDTRSTTLATRLNLGVARREVAIVDLVPDAQNRVIDESAEAFLTLRDSVRVMGVLVALQVQPQPGGKFHICDGERRWRAARAAGLVTVPCDVWAPEASPRDMALAGIVINEQREAHSVLAVARRLRSVKNQFAESHEQVAARTGLPIARVNRYLGLFNASDYLLAFLDEVVVPLEAAVELVRYEKTCGEGAARRILQKYREQPLTYRDIEALRKRQADKRPHKERIENIENPVSRRLAFAHRVEAAFRRDAVAAREELVSVAAKHGLRVVGEESTTGTSAPK
jgi:ParB/RepB/Spo0J family partition protein